MYSRVQWRPGLLGVATNLSFISPPTLTMNVKNIILPLFVSTSFWSWLPVSPIKLFRIKALVSLLWLLIMFKTPWMTARPNQVRPVRVARSEGKMVLFKTTVPSLFWKMSFLYSSIKPFGGRQCSLGTLTAFFSHIFSFFTFSAMSLRVWIFSKVSTDDLLKVPSEQEMAWHLTSL